MKKHIIFFALLILFISCDDSSLEDQGINLEVIPGVYVALNASGVTNTYSIEASEGNEVEINVEIPNNVGSFDNTTVTYSLSGTATFGVDYTVADATSTDGSILIEHKQDTDDLDNQSIMITLLTDSIEDDDETIIITLTSVSSPDGEISLGRPGADGPLLTTGTITIVAPEDYYYY